MTITLNNNVEVNLENSRKLIRWDMLQCIQYEKTNILMKWFDIMNCYPRAFSTPVVDITDGVVYGKTSCGVTKDNKTYKSIVKYVRESVIENISYGSKNDCIPGLHNNSIGRSLIGHRFISVADASKEYLEAIYAEYMEAMKRENDKGKKGTVTESKIKTEEKIPESNVSTVYNFHYSKLRNKTIQELSEVIYFYKKLLGKLNVLGFENIIEDYKNIIEEVNAYGDIISQFISIIEEEEFVEVGGKKILKKDIFAFLEACGINSEKGEKFIEMINSCK